MEPKTLPKPHEREGVVTGDPNLDLPPYEGEGEDLAAKWYGILRGTGEEITLEEFRRMRDEWSREGLDDFEELSAEATEHDHAVTGDPNLDLPPYEGEGEDLAAKWYGILNRADGTKYTTEAEIDAVLNEGSRERDFGSDAAKLRDE